MQNRYRPINVRRQINSTDMNEYENIKVGDRYNCYDDGKVRVSRQNVVTITNIIPKSNWTPELREEIARAEEDYDWLFDKVNHQICLMGITDEGEHCMFLKTQNGNWFSVGVWGPGLLDVTGNLTKNLINSLINRDFTYSKEQVDYFIKKLDNREICEDMRENTQCNHMNSTKLIIKTLKG